MAKIKFRIAAKTNVGLVRTNNEDNFQASTDLQVKPMKWVNNETCLLGEKGALFVVADGMGGMNAGEVASQIAIDTVREEFAPEKITAEVTKTRFSIEKFIKDVVVKADNRIKETAKKRPETRGMGTTIVIAWLYAGTLYVVWCGDSRAYVYNSKFGLHRLTKDHSYVQQLVDAGKLTEDEAFDFPESNIITRCLSDSKQKAEPEVLAKPYKVCKGDIIVLCTDGLCGMIRDTEMQAVLDTRQTDLNQTSDDLVQAALNASGADNVTVCLCQIISGGAVPKVPKTGRAGLLTRFYNFARTTKRTIVLVLLCTCFLVLGWALRALCFHDASGSSDSSNESAAVADSDSIAIQQEATDSASQPSSTTQESEVPETNEPTNVVSDISSTMKGISIPNTEEKKNHNADSVTTGLTENQSASTTRGNARSDIKKPEHETIKVVLPQGKLPSALAGDYNMTYKELENINPQIKDWKKVQPGDSLFVYKKKK